MYDLHVLLRGISPWEPGCAGFPDRYYIIRRQLTILLEGLVPFFKGLEIPSPNIVDPSQKKRYTVRAGHRPFNINPRLNSRGLGCPPANYIFMLSTNFLWSRGFIFIQMRKYCFLANTYVVLSTSVSKQHES
jgi:hypothetical protein